MNTVTFCLAAFLKPTSVPCQWVHRACETRWSHAVQVLTCCCSAESVHGSVVKPAGVAVAVACSHRTRCWNLGCACLPAFRTVAVLNVSRDWRSIWHRQGLQSADASTMLFTYICAGTVTAWLGRNGDWREGAQNNRAAFAQLVDSVNKQGSLPYACERIKGFYQVRHVMLASGTRSGNEFGQLQHQCNGCFSMLHGNASTEPWPTRVFVPAHMTRLLYYSNMLVNGIKLKPVSCKEHMPTNGI